MTEQRAQELLAQPGVNTRKVVFVSLGTLLFLGTSMTILALVFFTVVPSGRAKPPRQFPKPQLQAHPAADLQRYLNKQHSELTGYRWANSDHSLVVIPIDRAMTIIAQRGARAYEPLGADDAKTPQSQQGVQP